MSLDQRPRPIADAVPPVVLDRPARAGVAVYGCDPDEAALARELAPTLGVPVVVTRQPLTPTTAALARGRRCVSTNHRTPVDRRTLDALHRHGVEYLSTRSIGCDHVDVEHARSLGMSVDTVSYAPDGVADYTVMLMLMVLRDAVGTSRRVDAQDYRLPLARGRELCDLTVGVVGTGRIGGAVVARLQGFGCRVLAHDRRRAPVAAEHVGLDDLLRRSDVVTLHTPLEPSTRHLLDQRRLALLRPGAVVVNTARGALVDTEALLVALETGRLGGAALDVLEGEEDLFGTDRRERPVAGTTLERLHRLPQVVLSPHTAYFTRRVLRDAVVGSLGSCASVEWEHSRG